MDPIDKEIRQLEKRLKVDGVNIKTDQKFLKELGEDGFSELFSFVDSLSMFNDTGKHNQHLEKESYIILFFSNFSMY